MTYEQGFIRFNNFFKVYAQALPELIPLYNDRSASNSRIVNPL